MCELSLILKKIEKASPKSERTLAQDYFRELARWCNPEDQHFLLKVASELPYDLMLWAGISEILDKLNTETPSLIFEEGRATEDIQNTIKIFSQIARNRAIKINRISTHIMDARIKRICFRLSKISLNDLTKRLQKLWTNFREKNLQLLDIPDEILGIQFSPTNTYILLTTIKNIYYAIKVADSQTNLNAPDSTDIPPIFFRIFDQVSPGRLNAFRLSLEALEIMAYIHHHSQTVPTPLTNIEFFTFHDFVHCSKCWRLIPKFQNNESKDNNGKKYHKMLRTVYCDEHSPIECEGHTLTEYHKAIKLPCNNKKDGSDLFTSPKTIEIMKHFPSIAPVDPAGLSAQEWYEARVGPLHLLDLTKYPILELDLSWVWELCPNVLRYIEKANGNPNSPESILEILDPFTKKEEVEGKKLRKKLHELLAKNFGLYLQEIAMAETYLSEYNSQWDGRTHGGRRVKNKK